MSVQKTTFAGARARWCPEVSTLRDWLTWPARKFVFDRTLSAWRARPHRYGCPACGLTSADAGYCMGRATSDIADMGIHKWYSMGNGTYPASRTWIAEQMVSIDDERVVAAIAAYADRAAFRSKDGES